MSRPAGSEGEGGDRPVLVTGGAGFIGSHLVDALLAEGRRVRVLDDLSTGRRENLAEARAAGGDALDLLVGDLRDSEACERACRGVDLVYHQAALGSVPRSLADPATTIAVNVAGTANVFAAARDAGARRIVYASSSSVYGDSAELPKREGREGRSLSPYATSKRMGEALAEIFAASYGLELVGLRYFNVYGPRQSPEGPYAAVIPRFFEAALAGRAVTVHGDGGQSRDFTYVSDAVQANLLAARPEAPSGVYNVAGGRRTTILELAHAIQGELGVTAPPEHGPPRPGDVRDSLADLERAGRALGYRPEVPLEEGLARCREAYEKMLRPAG